MTASLQSDTRTGCEISGALADDSARAAPSSLTTRSRLFTKYDALLVAIVGITLLAGGIYEIFTHYREHRASLIRLQHEQATADDVHYFLPPAAVFATSSIFGLCG